MNNLFLVFQSFCEGHAVVHDSTKTSKLIEELRDYKDDYILLQLCAAYHVNVLPFQVSSDFDLGSNTFLAFESSESNSIEIALVLDVAEDMAELALGQERIELNKSEAISKAKGMVFITDVPDCHKSELIQQNTFKSNLLDSSAVDFGLLLLGVACLLMLPDGIYLLLAVLGSYLSFEKFREEHDLNSPLIEMICHQGRCGESSADGLGLVTRYFSKASLWFFISLSSFLAVSTYGGFDFSIPLLMLLLSSLVMIPVSLLAQVKAGKFCKVCIGVLVVLLAFLPLVFRLANDYNFEAYDFCSVVFSIFIVLLSMSIVRLVGRRLSSKRESITRDKRLTKFRHDGSIFNSFLQGDASFPEVLNGDLIIRAAVKPKWQLMIVIQMGCAPCKKVLEDLRLRIAQYDELETINYVIRFIESSRDGALKVNKIHNAIGNMKGPGIIEQVLLLKEAQTTDIVYEYISMKQTLEYLGKTKQWFESSGLAFTPSILINGVLVPDVYTIDDINRHFLSVEYAESIFD